MDYVVRLECVREEDLRQLLSMEQKHLRQLILQLRQDKLLKERTGQEEQAEGRPRKVLYYFTNYRAIVNVAKYKIDHMRQKLEAREKTKSHRSSYKCAGCSFHYDALDMDKIYDPSSGGLLCFRCNGAVEVDESAGPSEETRSSLAKFNDQLTPLFSLIRQLDGIRLAPHLLEPPVNNTIALARQQKAGGVSASTDATSQKTAAARPGAGPFRQGGGDAKRSEMYATDIGITVTIDNGQTAAKTEEKEVVPWLTASIEPAKEETGEEEATLPLTQPIRKKKKDAEILGLLQEEMAEPAETTASAAPPQRDWRPSVQVERVVDRSTTPPLPMDILASPKRANEEKVEVDEEEGEEHVTVKGVRYHFDDVTTEMVEQMTAQEREAYTRLSMAYNDY